MLYFEDATVDFFGLPMAYFPFLSTPDPTVKRKSGFLFPTFTSGTAYGVGVTLPYYLALAPNYDLTLYPTYTSQQGFLMEADWEHSLPRQLLDQGRRHLPTGSRLLCCA